MKNPTAIEKEQERLLGQRKTPPANKLHKVTSRLMSNTTRKYILTEYRSSITRYLNGLDLYLSRSLDITSTGAIRLLIYGFLLMFNCNISSNWLLYEILGFESWVTFNLTFKVNQGQMLKCHWMPHIWFPINV